MRVLLVTRDFPPHRSGGVRRVAALAGGLAQEGFEVTALAAEGKPQRRYVPVSAWIRGASRKLRCGWLYRRLVRWVAIPDEWVLDLPALFASAVGLERPDVILASAPPNSLLVAADLLARRVGCPWVADFRDPWTDHPRFDPATPLHRAAHEALERRAILGASAILAATEMMAVDLRARVKSGTPVHAFFNGFDPEHFMRLPRTPRSRGSGRITVGYYGSFYGAIDPEPLVQAVLRAGARLEHAGQDFDGALARAARRHGVEVGSLGMLSNEEAAARMQQADVLAMVLPDDPEWAYVRTQKLAEYLASGRPILALVPPGEAADLIVRLDAGIAVRPGATEEAARAIRTLAAKTGTREMPMELSWRRQVGEVARLLRTVLERRRG